MSELDPRLVALRLREVGKRWEPASAAEARAAMSPPRLEKSFDAAVARRLTDLRALLELSRYLQDASPRT